MVFHSLNTGKARLTARFSPVFRQWKTITRNIYRYPSHRVSYIYYLLFTIYMIWKVLSRRLIILAKLCVLTCRKGVIVTLIIEGIKQEQWTGITSHILWSSRENQSVNILPTVNLQFSFFFSFEKSGDGNFFIFNTLHVLAEQQLV